MAPDTVANDHMAAEGGELLALVLGAGFSYPAGVPLASQLFDEEPQVDRVTRRQLVRRTLAGWHAWRERTGGQPEEYLAHLAGGPDGSGFPTKAWPEAIWYVALRIALTMGSIEAVDFRRTPTIVRHDLMRTVGCREHVLFWDSIFRRPNPPTSVAVVTTNYDVLIERGLRRRPTPRAFRPGFNYGNGPEQLEGSGYPSFAHVRLIYCTGNVPLFKLHGSASWSVRNGSPVKYIDCRPAIRGDAAIVAPVPNKSVPGWLQPVWIQAEEHLKAARHWIVVGYSFPTYDHQVNALVTRASQDGPQIDVFDPDGPAVAYRLRRLTPSAAIFTHPGLPLGCEIITSMELG